MSISLQLGKFSHLHLRQVQVSFIIHNSSLLFWREKVLSEMGLRIVRFQNDEVVRDLSTVVGKIRESCAMNSDDKLGESNQ